MLTGKAAQGTQLVIQRLVCDLDLTMPHPFLAQALCQVL